MKRALVTLYTIGAGALLPTIAWAQTPAEAETEAETKAEAETETGAETETETPSASEQPEAPPDPNAAPWSGATDVTLPTFLQDTGKRVVDERPGPTPQQIEALRQMQAEVDGFMRSGNIYQNTVGSLVRREYLRQRRARSRWFSEQVLQEEQLLNEAREGAIRLFEKFIAAYPNSEEDTPDAMFRLGELYFERSAIAFQTLYDEAQVAQDAGDETAGDNLPISADFTPTIELYKKLVKAFPQYQRVDGVYYLIGYCLNEMGRAEEALAAWLALVCANKYTYDPNWAAPPPAPGEEFEEKYPALLLDGRPLGSTIGGVFVDQYRGCRPVAEDARFVSETWFRIGEYHFDDYTGENAIDLSIGAYNQILKDVEDRNYNLATRRPFSTSACWSIGRTRKPRRPARQAPSYVPKRSSISALRSPTTTGTKTKFPIPSRASRPGWNAFRMASCCRRTAHGHRRSTSSSDRCISKRPSTTRPSRRGASPSIDGRPTTASPRRSTTSRRPTSYTTNSRRRSRRAAK